MLNPMICSQVQDPLLSLNSCMNCRPSSYVFNFASIEFGYLNSFEAKLNTYELGRQFMHEFKESNGSCTCEQIIGFNIGTPDNHKRAQDMKLFETRCLDACLLYTS